MKRYKLLTQDGYDRFKEGEIYEEDFTLSFTTVKEFSEKYPSDWELVTEETDEEVVNKLVELYGFNGESARHLITEWGFIERGFNTPLNIYDIAKIINEFNK